MARLISTNDVCSIGEIGQVIWLECYFDGHTSLEPYMFDIGFTQKPVMTNAHDEFYNLWESDVKKHVISGFGIKWRDKRFRWWDSMPSDSERDECKEWEIIAVHS